VPDPARYQLGEAQLRWDVLEAEMDLAEAHHHDITPLEARNPPEEDMKCFPIKNLPAEIRRMIWRLCLPSRILPMLEQYQHHRYSEEHHGLQHVCPVTSNDLQLRPPIITRVCHESRSIAFETGAIYVSCEMSANLADDPPCRLTWFDPTNDVLELHSSPYEGLRITPGESHSFTQASYLEWLGPFGEVAETIAVMPPVHELLSRVIEAFGVLLEKGKWQRLRTIYLCTGRADSRIVRASNLDYQVPKNAPTECICVLPLRNEKGVARPLEYSTEDPLSNIPSESPTTIDYFLNPDFISAVQQNWLRYYVENPTARQSEDGVDEDGLSDLAAEIEGDRLCRHWTKIKVSTRIAFSSSFSLAYTIELERT
jgi:hypothetical protein